MKRAFLLLPGLMLPLAAQNGNAELDRLLRGAVEQKRVPGVVAMVAAGNGITYQGAFGFDRDAIFDIASMTKAITSVAVMQLVEAGRVKLDEPASTYLPALAKTQVLEGGKLRPPRRAITVRHLLTHTAGFSYEFMHRDLSQYVQAGKAPSIMSGGDGFLSAPLVADPGATWEYGINTDWLGKLVEEVSGQTLEAYFRQKIFEPLGMPDTHYNVPKEKQSRIAAIYLRAEDGTLTPRPSQPVAMLEHFPGGMGLRSTAADYLKFTRALLAGGELGGRRILKAATVDMMGKNQIGNLALRPFTSLAPQFARDKAEVPGGLDKFGLGFAINSRAAGKRGAGTMAWAGIYNTFFWIDRQNKVCAVLMTQMSPGMDEGPRSLLMDFERAVYEGLR